MDRCLIKKVKLALLTMQRYSWEQGVAAQACLELGDTELTVLLAREAVHRQSEDGRLGVMGPNVMTTDPGACGEPVLYAWRVTGEAIFREAAERMLDYLLHRAPRAANGAILLFSDPEHPWVLIDSIYHSPTLMAVMGEYDEVVRQVEAYRELIFDPGKQLYRAMWDARNQTWLRQQCWGGGNGWVAAALARIIRALPGDRTADRQRLIGYQREVIDGCLKHQRADGLFHDMVDDPGTYVETNLANMLAYAIFRGVSGGWLDSSYLELARTMRAATHARVDEHGLVQGVASAPAFDQPGVSPEGQAFFLLEAAAGECQLDRS